MFLYNIIFNLLFFFYRLIFKTLQSLVIEEKIKVLYRTNNCKRLKAYYMRENKNSNNSTETDYFFKRFKSFLL